MRWQAGLLKPIAKKGSGLSVRVKAVRAPPSYGSFGLISFTHELGVHISRSAAFRGVAGDIKERTGLFTGRAPIGNRVGLEHVSAFLTLPLGHLLTS